MSVVSGVVLICTVGEDGMDADPDEGGDPWKLREINNWLAENKVAGTGLEDQSEATAGGKHPQFYLFGAGFNYFPENEFADFVMGLQWDFPENVVLIIEPEDGATRVWRPVGQQQGRTDGD